MCCSALPPASDSRLAAHLSCRVLVQAYRQAAKRLHPDKSMAEGVSKEAAEKAFHDLAEAYEVRCCLSGMSTCEYPRCTAV